MFTKTTISYNTNLNSYFFFFNENVFNHNFYVVFNWIVEYDFYAVITLV